MRANYLLGMAVAISACIVLGACGANEFVVKAQEKASSSPTSQPTCFPKQITSMKQDYDVEVLNARRSCLKKLQKDFYSRFRPKFKGDEYPEIKWFLKALIELDGKFIDPTDLSTLVQNAVLGAVAHAKVRSKGEISYTQEIFRTNTRQIHFHWPERISMADDIKIIENFLITLQELRAEIPHLEIKDLVQAGIYGMYKSVGNPYTGSYPAFPEVDDAISLKAGTIVLPKLGMSIGHKNGVPTVTKILGGFTAYQAGVKKDDQILKIQEKSLQSKTLKEVAVLLEGQSNVITVRRRTPRGFEQVKLILPNTLWYNYFRPDETTRYHLLENKIGYIRIGAFDREPTNTLAGEEAKFSILDDALSFFSKNRPEGLILDLRNNPGGYSLVAEKVASLFLRPGQVIAENWSKFQTPTKTMSQPGRHADYPLVVLINERSASASEVVAAALKHYGRALLIGTSTFGKGTAWVPTPKPDLSGGVFLTTMKWLTPGRKSIEQVGVQPDVTFENEDFTKPKLSKYLSVLTEKKIERELALNLLETAFMLLKPEIRQRTKSVHVQLGEEHLRRKNFFLAEEEFRLALRDSHMDGSAIIGLGNVYRHYEAFEMAEGYYSRAIQTDPRNSAGYYHRGIKALFKGDSKRAVKDFEKVVELNPFYPGVNYYLGVSLHRLGQKKQAKHHLKLATIFDTNMIGN